MPIGGQYLMRYNDPETKLGSSFSGTLDGQGHTVTVNCDRWAYQYGDGQSVGLIGRLGVHDNDPANTRPSGAGVKNIIVRGSISANRSVGGIVGKIGKTADTAIIENCANYARITATDAKGVGGIVGAAWNDGLIVNCYNAGAVSESLASPAGGIAGSVEFPIVNSYSYGIVTAPVGYAILKKSYAKDGNVIYTLAGSGTVKFVNNAKTFDDVKAGAWYEDAVAFVTARELFNGTSATTFAPELEMTRAMLATVLYRLEGEPAVTSANPYTDVKSGEWYTDAIIWASENGIVNGYGDGLFGTEDNITREQIVTILYRFAKLNGYNVAPSADLTKYTDAGKISDWASDAMKWAVSIGLVNGRSETTLVPEGNATRAEVAAILQRFIENVVK
jgi:hypothetical protein